MNIFKSPLLLMGILIIAITAGALIGPYFIDWGSYRSQFEKVGNDLTGRDTKIHGDISVQLFPWPRLVINDVHIANPPEAMLKEFFRADELEVKLALAPLLSGKVKIEGININRPVFGLERMVTGKSSWSLAPKSSFSKLIGADDIAVSGISITNGTIVLADGKRRGEAQLDGFNAFVSARSLAGPWKLKGEAVVNDEGVSISASTGKLQENQPLKFSFRIAPSENAGIVYTFNGIKKAGVAGNVSGKLKVMPTKSKSGKADAHADFRPIGMRANIKANFDEWTFSDIEIAPIDAIDAQTFVKGSAVVKLGSVIRVDSRLAANRLDVDTLLGIRGRKTIRSAQSLDALAGFVEALPKNVQLRSRLDVKNLTIAGEPLSGMKLDLSVFGTTLKINTLNIALPGQSRAIFTGSFIAGKAQPQLIGDLAFNSAAMRDFAKWALIENRSEIERVWSGTRGAFKVSGKLDMSRGNVRLRDGKFVLDQSIGDLNFHLATGDKPGVTFEIGADELDIDRYVPDGFIKADNKQSLPDLFITNIARLVGEQDINLKTNIGKLKLNGVEAKDVIVEFVANENSVDFRRVKLGQVGSASLDFSGVIQFLDTKGVKGSLNGWLKAENPAPLLKLVGVSPVSEQWLKAVSPVAVQIIGNADAGQASSRGRIEISGSIGKTSLRTSAQLGGKLKEWQTSTMHLSGQLSGKSAKAMLELFSLSTDKGKDTSGRISFSGTGNLKAGLATTADMEMFGATMQFSGKVLASDNGPLARGRIAVLVENTDPVLEILGIDARNVSALAKVFSGEGEITATQREITIKNVRGTAAGTSFLADLSLGLQNETPNLQAQIVTGRASLPFVFGAVLLGRNGKPFKMSSRFSPKSFSGVNAEISLAAKKLVLWPGFELGDGQLKFAIEGNKVDFGAEGEKIPGKPVKISLFSVVGSQVTTVKGKVRGQSVLSDLLKAPNQETVLGGIVNGELVFSGQGRTPGGVLAGLKGQGKIKVSGGAIANLSPEKFASQISGAKTANDVDVLISKQLQNGGMSFEDGEAKVAIGNGVVNVGPLAIKGQGANGSLKAVFELTNGLFDMAAKLKLTKQRALPGFEIAFVGPPASLTRSSDFSALKSYVTQAAIKRDFERMEAIAKEQQRLIDEEKRQREELAAKRKKQLEAQRLLREKQRELLRQKEKEREKSTVVKPVDTPVKTPVIKPVPKPAPVVKKKTIKKKRPVRPKVQPQVNALPPAIIIPEQPIPPPVSEPPIFPTTPVRPRIIKPAPKKSRTQRQDNFEDAR